MMRASLRSWSAWVAWALLSSVAATAQAKPATAKEPEAQTEGPRKLVIAAFSGEAGERARQVALEIVAGRTDRTDYAVVGHDDVEVVAKRLGVASDSDRGRQLISTELGIDLWLDGELDAGGSGELRLQGGEGARLARLPLEERDAARALAVLNEELWPWIGALVSEKERVARKLQVEHERALAKVAAREEELVRQRRLVVEREERRLARLETARALALEKKRARHDELARQVEIVRERALAEAREQQRKREEMQRALALQAERQRLEEQAALERQRAAEAQLRARQQAQQRQAAGQPAATTWQPPQNQWQQPQPAEPSWQQPQPAPAADQPSQNQWQQPQPAASNWQPPQNQWQQPQPSAGWQAPPADAAPAQDGVPVIEGISPEMREWLERKQRERAAER